MQIIAFWEKWILLAISEGTSNFPPLRKTLSMLSRLSRQRKNICPLEESNLAYWTAQVASPFVTEVIPRDPRENALIYKSSVKKDKIDTKKLCRLLRLGELKRVCHPESDDRAIFKAVALHYIDLRDQQTALKQKIKAMYRHWGVIEVAGQAVYSDGKRHDYLNKTSKNPKSPSLLVNG